ncbi:MAG: hypothetical protein ACRDHW_02555 [Ktedonobacteraceae bacterium]
MSVPIAAADVARVAVVVAGAAAAAVGLAAVVVTAGKTRKPALNGILM